MTRGSEARPKRSRRNRWRSKAEGAVKEEAPEKDAEGAPNSPLPLLDLTDAGVKKMIKAAKKRGYRHLRAAQRRAAVGGSDLRPDRRHLAMLSEMGINVVETRTPTARRARPKRPPTSTTTRTTTPAARWSRPSRSRWPSPRRRSRPSAPTIRCACICARWARSSCCRARAKSPSPSASRPAARR